MSARSVIVIGDKTTHGGSVLQGSQTMTAGAKMLPDKVIWSHAVSYTHLDVYKRQI